MLAPILPSPLLQAWLLSATVAVVSAQSLASCSPSLTPTNAIKPSVASGYQVALVATGLSKPRSIQFDDAGNLLVVQSGKGSLSSLQLQDNGGVCLGVKSQKNVITGAGVSGKFVLLGATVTNHILCLAQSWSSFIAGR